MKSIKDGLLYIRCSKKTEKRFKQFALDIDAKNYEEALIILLDRGVERSRIAVEPTEKR